MQRAGKPDAGSIQRQKLPDRRGTSARMPILQRCGILHQKKKSCIINKKKGDKKMAIITTYQDRGTSYLAQKGITLKIETNTSAPIPENRGKMFAKKGDEEYFPCKIDNHGNICDNAGIVIYPSKSGKIPLKAGEKGEFDPPEKDSPEWAKGPENN